MTARWLIMLLGANAGGGTTVVSMVSHVEPRALAFYRKARDGRLTMVRPHTDKFKSTVTSTGIKNFEGIIEGELLSPCELEPAPGIAFVGDTFTIPYSRENAIHFIKTWKDECRSRLHGRNEKEKNIGIGVMLGIIAHSTRYLCHKNECGGRNGASKQLNLISESTIGKIGDDAFGSNEALVKNYKLTETFFNAIGRLIAGGSGSCQAVYGDREVEKSNCDKFVKKIKGGEVEEECPRTDNAENTGQYDQKCFEWAKNMGKSKRLFVLEKQSETSRQFTEEEWWKRRNGVKGIVLGGEGVAFGWGGGADPENQGENRGASRGKKTYNEIRKYWNSSLGASDVCIPVPAMTRKENFQANFDMTIEAIRCGQKNL